MIFEQIYRQILRQYVNRSFSILAIYFFLLLVIFEPLSAEEKERNGSKYHIVICALFQDEEIFLREWIEYHRLLKVEHFYLYNNLSTDGYLNILQPYIDKGLVDLFDWPIPSENQETYLTQLQMPMYLHALNLARENADWAAFIDLDEFIQPKVHEDLAQLLEEYQNYGALAINWQLFGTSWISHIPPGELLTEHLVWKAEEKLPLNEMIKMVVQTSKVKDVYNPHTFEFYPGEYAVNSDKKPLAAHASSQEVIVDTVQIRHYWSGPEEWFLTHKLPRREKWGMKIPAKHLTSLIYTYNAVKDETLFHFLPLLKKAMYGPVCRSELCLKR